MRVNIPLLLIGIIIIIQLYINFFVINKKVEIEEDEESVEEELSNINVNDINDVNNVNNVNNVNINKVPDIINKLGKPTINNSNYMLWVINKPKPWEEIVYKFEDKYPIKFVKTVFIPNNEIFNKWKEIIPNIEINKNKLPNKVKLIIPARDEESALGILNLMINTFKNQLSFEEIIKNNLIEVSLLKIKNHPVIKKKIIEQIMEIKNDSDNDSDEINIDSSEFENDLANTETIKNVNDIPAYGGNEFSFIT
jgi:hypothetical protein